MSNIKQNIALFIYKISRLLHYIAYRIQIYKPMELIAEGWYCSGYYFPEDENGPEESSGPFITWAKGSKGTGDLIPEEYDNKRIAVFVKILDE